MNKLLIQTMVFVIAMLVASHAWAQSDSSPIPWGNLSPNEKKVLAPLKKSWNNLPAARQQRMKKSADRLAGMSAQDRLKAQTRLKQWKKLGPQKKKRILKSMEKFENLPPSKRQALRRQRDQFKDLPKRQRQIIRRKWEALPRIPSGKGPDRRPVPLDPRLQPPSISAPPSDLPILPKDSR